MDKLGYFSVNRPNIVHETIEGETVIVNLENGIYYSLRDSGVDLWNLIEMGANLDELTGAMIERYRGSEELIRQAISDLLVTLQKEGLVQASSTKPASDQPLEAWNGKEKQDFASPILEKYSDMQELLLLDPIHEVDEEGWPHKAEEDGAGNAGQG